MSTPTTAQALAQQVFQVPQKPESTEPSTPGVTPFGGVSPAVQGASPSALSGSNMPQATPVASGNVPQTPASQTPPTVPAGQAPPTQAAPLRTVLDSYVKMGFMTDDVARQYRSDEDFLLELHRAQQSIEKQREELTQLQSQPKAQTPPPASPPQEDLVPLAMSLLEAGTLEIQAGRYVAKIPELQRYADEMNRQNLETQRQMAELRNPGEWLKKHGSTLVEEATASLRQEIAALKEQLSASVPKPHEQWIAQHKDKLYVNGSTELSPAGTVYDRTYRAMSSQGITDPAVLHKIAAEAATPLLAQTVVTSPQPQPQPPSFWAQASQSPSTDAGFALPGTSLSAHQREQSAIPVTNRGTPDMMAMVQGAISGNLPRS